VHPPGHALVLLEALGDGAQGGAGGQRGSGGGEGVLDDRLREL